MSDSPLSAERPWSCDEQDRWLAECRSKAERSVTERLSLRSLDRIVRQEGIGFPLGKARIMEWHAREDV